MECETAEKAAKWWADQLRGSAKLDNGDTSETGGMVALMAAMLQGEERSRRGASDADKFEKALTDTLCELDGDWITLGCDYGPDNFLSQVADKAGVNLGMTGLPWKTNMYIRNDRVSVACGYGTSAVEL